MSDKVILDLEKTYRMAIVVEEFTGETFPEFKAHLKKIIWRCRGVTVDFETLLKQEVDRRHNRSKQELARAKFRRLTIVPPAPTP